MTFQVNRRRSLDRITELITLFRRQVESENAAGHLDINHYAENILLPIFAKLYGYSDLKNLNTERGNYPAVDLGDERSKVSIQITSDSNSPKVAKTIKKFIDNALYERYEHLIVYIITEKQRSYRSNALDDQVARINGRFQFDKKQDIRDYRDLLRAIDAADIEIIQWVEDYLEKNFINTRKISNIFPHLADYAEMPLEPKHRLDRPQEETELRESVISTEKQTTILQGPAGTGKTTLAMALAKDEQVNQAFSNILWLNAGTLKMEDGQTPNLFPLYYFIAESLSNKEDVHDEASARQAARKCLEKDRCLIILDDVWELGVGKAFQKLIVNTDNRLFITTRTRELGRELDAAAHQLEKIDEALAVHYLQNWVEKDPHLDQVAKAVGYLFFALKIAAVLMERLGLSGAEFVEEHAREKGKFLDEKSGDEERASLRASLTLSVDAAIARAEDQTLFHALGIFPEDTFIPQSVILQLWAELRPDLSQHDLTEFLSALVDYAILDRRENKIYKLHDIPRQLAHDELADNYVQTQRAFLASYGYTKEGTAWHEMPNDGYIYDHLIYHFKQSELHEEIHALFLSEDWARKRPLPKMLQDLDGAKRINSDKDIAASLRYVIFDEVFRWRFVEIPKEVTVEALKRRRSSNSIELIGSMIAGVKGSPESKVEMYIEHMEQTTSPSIKEQLALDAFELIRDRRIRTSKTVSALLKIYPFIATKQRHGIIKQLWRLGSDSETQQQREELYEGIMPKLSEDQISDLVSELIESDMSPGQQVHILKEVKNYLGPEHVEKAASVTLTNIEKEYRDYVRACLLARLIGILPEALQRKAQKSIVPMFMACDDWGPEHSEFEKNCFVALVPYIPPEDIGNLWRRAHVDASHQEYGARSQSAERVQLAIVKRWLEIGPSAQRALGIEKEVRDFLINKPEAELDGMHRILWCELQAKYIPLLPEDTQEQKWLDVVSMAMAAYGGWAGSDKTHRERKREWLDEFCSGIPGEVATSVWQSILRMWEEELEEHERTNSLGTNPPTTQHLWAMAGLANKIPVSDISECLRSIFSLGMSYEFFFFYTEDTFGSTSSRLLDRLAPDQRELQWSTMTDALVRHHRESRSGRHEWRLLFYIAGKSSNLVWKEQKLAWLLETTPTLFPNASLSGGLFDQLSLEDKMSIWLSEARKLNENDSNEMIFKQFESMYPEVLERVPELEKQINWDFHKWRRSLNYADKFHYRSAARAFLKCAPPEFQLAAFRYNKAQGGEGLISLKAQITLFEQMNDAEQQELLDALENSYLKDEQFQELAALVDGNWSAQSIWKAWKYMHAFDPDKDWNWALALAPFIPEQFVVDAYQMTKQHWQWPQWPQWVDICKVLAARLPTSFADKEWRRLSSLIKEGKRSRYSLHDQIKLIQLAMVPGISDAQLANELDRHINRKAKDYKQLIKNDLIGGSLFHYLRSIFLPGLPDKYRFKSASYISSEEFEHPNTPLWTLWRLAARVGANIYGLTLTEIVKT